MHIAMECW